MGYEKQYFNHGKTPHSMILPGVGDVFGGTLPAKIFSQTWSDYRTLQEPNGSLSSTPTPAPATTYTTRPTPTKAPSPHRTPSPTTKPTQAPTAKPTPIASPSQTLIPTAAPGRPAPGQPARRDRFET